MVLFGTFWLSQPVNGVDLWPFILPEQTEIQVRNPSDLPRSPIVNIRRPPTVSDPQFELPPRHLSLDEAISTGLANSEVVRVLAGVTAASSGRTVYDVALSNTLIDQQRAAFDPAAAIGNTWNRNEPPSAFFDPLDPSRALIGGTRTDNYNFNFGLTKRTSTGGTLAFGANSDDSRFRPGIFPLNPQARSSTDFSFTQPLVQGGGVTVNQIPIVLAQIDTERSFFQYKDSVQQHVRGVIEAYWALVFARTDLWAREQQTEQAEFANLRTEMRLQVRDANLGEAAQTRVALENFRASLLSAQANVLQREAALRNILGFPPYDPNRVVPVTPPSEEKLPIDWEGIVELAGEQRPDIIELKLILEADEQLLRQSRNDANPRIDATALYRWNGLDGTMPIGLNLASRSGAFTDWTMGVNFSVPLGLRRERAALRQRELVIARDRANLTQGVHQMVHLLALNVRNLDQFYQQYRRFQAVRAAAKINLDRQLAAYNQGLVQFIVALQAIVDWGNAVSSEAQSLTQYNTEIANLEFATGTILESHGVAFYEERFGSLGPLGRFSTEQCYPSATLATPTVDRYPVGEQPSEEFFELRDPLEERNQPPPAPVPPESHGGFYPPVYMSRLPTVDR
jgi:outer membrane protein TolC